MLGRTVPGLVCKWLRHFIANVAFHGTPLNKVLDAMRECPSCHEATVSMFNLLAEVSSGKGVQCPDCKAIVNLDQDRGIVNVSLQILAQVIASMGALYALYYSNWLLCFFAVVLTISVYFLAKCFGRLSIGGLRGSLKNFNASKGI